MDAGWRKEEIVLNTMTNRIFLSTILILVSFFSLGFLAREYTKVDTFVRMGDIWSFLTLDPENPAVFREIDRQDFPGPPYPAPGDTLLSIAGGPASLERYFEIFSPETPAGLELPVTFVSGGRIYENRVVTRSVPAQLRFQVSSLFLLRTLIAAALILVGAWAFLRRPDHNTVRVMTLFCFGLAVTAILTRPVISDQYAGFDLPIQGILVNSAFLLVLFMPAFWLKLQFLFPRPMETYQAHRTAWNILVYLPPTVLALLDITGLIQPQPWMEFYRILFLAAGFGLLLRSYRLSGSFIEKRQARLVLWGSWPGLLLYMATSAVVFWAPEWQAGWSTLQNLYVFNLNYLLLLLTPLSLAYAIRRYRLLEVEWRLRRGTLTLALNVGLLSVLFLALFAAGDLLLRGLRLQGHTFSLVLGIVLALLISPAQATIRSWLQRKVDPARHRLRDLVRDFLESPDLVADPTRFWRELSRRLSEGLSAPGTYPLLRAGDDAVLHVHGNEPTPFRLTDPWSGEFAHRRYPILVDEARASGRIGLTPDQERWLEDRNAALLVPLWTRSGLLGLLVLGRKANGEDYAPDELELLRTMAAQVALTAENLRLLEVQIQMRRLEEEIRLGRRIQEGLLPSRLPDTPRLSLAARVRFCLDVAGDYYDVIPLADGRTLLAIGDVAGKGVGPALLMANLQASLRVLAGTGIPLHQIVRQINSLIHQNTPPGLFITLFTAIHDPEGQTLEYVNAGHDAPILRREDGSLERLLDGGLVLGVRPDEPYQSSTVRVGPGDVLLMYTDGISEARNPGDEFFGEERIAQAPHRYAGLPLSQMLLRLEDEVSVFCGSRDLEDDFTLLAARFSG